MPVGGEIRRARPEDEARILELQAGYYAEDGYPHDAAKTFGAHALHLEVETDKTETIRLYERNGFSTKTRAAMTRWLVDAPGQETTQ